MRRRPEWTLAGGSRRARPSVAPLVERAAEHEGTPMGYATFFESQDELASDRPRIHIGQFFIRRERRKLGLGTELFKMLEQEWFPVGAKIVLDVLVGNSTAQTFYRSLGFAPYSMLMEKG